MQTITEVSIELRAGTHDGVHRYEETRQRAFYRVNQPFSGPDIVWLARDAFAPRDNMWNRREVVAADDARSEQLHDSSTRNVLSQLSAPHTVIAKVIAG